MHFLQAASENLQDSGNGPNCITAQLAIEITCGSSQRI